MNENDLKLRDKLALRTTEILLEKGFDNPLRQTNFFQFKNSNPVKLANMMVSGKTLSFDDIQEFVHGEQTGECHSSSNECCEDSGPYDYLTNVYEGKGYKDLNNICGNSVQFKDDSTSRTFISFYLGDKNEKIEDDVYSLDDICFEYIKTTIDSMMPNVKKVKSK